MITKNLSMPIPVLGIKQDMSGSFNVNFKVVVDRNDRKYNFSEFEIDITNPFIKRLYDDDLVSHVFKVNCTPTYKNWTFQNPSNISIPENEIDLVLEVESFLVTKTTINEYSHESFDSIFSGYSFDLQKGEIIAMTGSKRIVIEKENEKASLGSIFKFSKIDINAEFQAMHFDFDDDQIIIYYPSSVSSFDPITFLFDRNEGLPFTALNLYIIPALTEAFNLIQDKEEYYKEKRWAYILSSLLPESQWDENAFINAQKVLQSNIPVNMAFEEILKSKKIYEN